MAELRRLQRPRRGDGGGALIRTTLRVAHLLPTLEIGGKERSVVDLCAAAPALGIAPLIVTYDPAPPGRRTIEPGDVGHVALDRRAPDFAARLAELLDSRGVQLLHAHGHVAAVYAAAARPHCATLATIHAALGGGWRWLPQILPALRRMDRIAAVSADLARATRRLTLRPVATIPTGIDTGRFGPAPDRIAGDPVTFGIAARLHPVKRHRDLFAAVALLGREGVPLRLRVAGEGPLEAALRAQAAPMPQVEMLGAVADMPGFYRSLDAFILCSDHEGLPLALIEAMASRLPCVATRTGGMIDLIGDGMAGVTGVPRRDPAALAAAMRHLIAEPAWRETSGRRARVASLSRSLAAQATAYDRLYRAIAA